MLTKQFVQDVAERALFTFVETFLAMFVLTDLTTAKTAAVGGAAAVLAVVKGMIATRVGQADTAAALPAR